MIHIITKIDKGKFDIQWEGKPETLIHLDFNPLVDNFKLDNAYVLGHWQAIPKGLRRWGLYCGLSDNYYSCEYDQVMFGRTLLHRFLQIPELNYPDTKPTATTLYTGARVRIIEDKFLVA